MDGATSVDDPTATLPSLIYFCVSLVFRSLWTLVTVPLVYLATVVLPYLAWIVYLLLYTVYEWVCWVLLPVLIPLEHLFLKPAVFGISLFTFFQPLLVFILCGLTIGTLFGVSSLWLSNSLLSHLSTKRPVSIRPPIAKRKNKLSFNFNLNDVPQPSSPTQSLAARSWSARLLNRPLLPTRFSGSASEVSETEDYLSTTSRDDTSDVDRSESGSEGRKKRVTWDLPQEGEQKVEADRLEVKQGKERSLSPNVSGPRRRVGSKERSRKATGRR